MTRLDPSILTRCIAAYRAVEAHPSGAGAWKGETADSILEAEVGDVELARLYRHEIIDAVRQQDEARVATVCPECGAGPFRGAQGMKAHRTRMHPPDPHEIAERRAAGETIKALALAYDMSVATVYTALDRARDQRRSA